MDKYSYECGIIDCFNEMVKAGLKPLALSHPCISAEERDSFLPFCEKICHHYQTCYYTEDDPLLSDLFPLSMNQNKFNILFYYDKKIIDAYLALKNRKEELVNNQAYIGKEREMIAVEFGKLLGYPLSGIKRLMDENQERE